MRAAPGNRACASFSDVMAAVLAADRELALRESDYRLRVLRIEFERALELGYRLVGVAQAEQRDALIQMANGVGHLGARRGHGAL